jgi:hypothetical protein
VGWWPSASHPTWTLFNKYQTGFLLFWKFWRNLHRNDLFYIWVFIIFFHNDLSNLKLLKNNQLLWMFCHYVAVRIAVKFYKKIEFEESGANERIGIRKS